MDTYNKALWSFSDLWPDDLEWPRAIASTGMPLMLIDGLGWVWQRWVFTEVTEVKSVLFADGTPHRIEFRVALRAYGKDAA